MSKPLVYLVPSYIAALRYYEKIVPYLESEYEVRFLLIGGGSMKAYCDENNVPHDILWDKPQVGSIGLNNIPIITPLVDRRLFVKKCRALLREKRPAKIVMTVPNRHFYLRALAGHANEMGIDTAVLQWALGVPENNPREKIRHQLKDPREWRHLLREQLFLMHRVLVRGVMRLHDMLGFGQKLSFGPFEPSRFGVINEGGKGHLVSLGCPEKKLEVVGTIDTEYVKEMKEKFDTDEVHRTELYKKYDLNPKKKIALIISTTFHLPSTTKIYTYEEQVAYFKKHIEILRKHFNKDEMDIVFKIHPREQDIYTKEYEELGAKVFGKESSVEELMVLANLYISHPLTSTSFSLHPLGTDAIFVNVSPLEFMDRAGKYFGITYIAKTNDEFDVLVGEYKEGALEKQYSSDEVILDAKDKILRFIEG